MGSRDSCQGSHKGLLLGCRGYLEGRRPAKLKGLSDSGSGSGLSDTRFGFTLTLNNLPFKDLYKEIIIRAF